MNILPSAAVLRYRPLTCTLHIRSHSQRSPSRYTFSNAISLEEQKKKRQNATEKSSAKPVLQIDTYYFTVRNNVVCVCWKNKLSCFNKSTNGWSLFPSWLMLVQVDFCVDKAWSVVLSGNIGYKRGMLSWHLKAWHLTWPFVCSNPIWATASAPCSISYPIWCLLRENISRLSGWHNILTSLP